MPMYLGIQFFAGLPFRHRGKRLAQKALAQKAPLAPVAGPV
jgi:hypothetical protein